jgi:hypothetical protein
MRRRIEHQTEPFAHFLNETEPHKAALWDLYDVAMGVVAPHHRCKPNVGAHVAPPVGPTGTWNRAYRSADLLSNAYADRYRSSYVLVFLLAALAVAAAVIMLEWHRTRIVATPIEFVLLLVIALVVGLNDAEAWHRRWIGYRFLAELCRKQQALLLLGWSLPAFKVRRVAGRAAAHGEWIGWYFNALMRATPLPVGDLSGPSLLTVRKEVTASLLTGQVEYHAQRGARSEEAGRTLERWGEWAFLITILCVVCKGVVLFLLKAESPIITALSLAAALAPGATAAFFGVRAYAELDLLADQSRRMETLMHEAERVLAALPLDRPLASQQLAAELFDLATQMLVDVDGWAQLFQLKAVELS